MYIYQIQEALEHKGYSPGPQDNIPGPQTQTAIIAFQSDHGLNPDGMVGPLTHQALFQNLNPAFQSAEDLPSPHFNREEFKCCCEGRYCNGFPCEINPELLKRLEAARQDLSTPIIVTSGVRCPSRNQEVGGIPDSKHLIGYAVDCYAPGLSIETLAAAAKRQNLGVILYHKEGFCHLEI